MRSKDWVITARTPGMRAPRCRIERGLCPPARPAARNRITETAEAGELVPLHLDKKAMLDWQIALVREKRRTVNSSAEKLVATLTQRLPELLREKVPT
jgi:hypothetical protein